MDKIAFLFPGQGAQYLGMGQEFYQEFPIYRESIEEAEDYLHREINHFMIGGPNGVLQQTNFCQLAMFVSSMGILRVINHLLPDCQAAFCAGLSVGEYAALCASGVLSYRDALLLVDRRGKLMQEACESNKGVMTAVIGISWDRVIEILNSKPEEVKAYVSNFNASTQIVVSGDVAGLSWFKEVAKAKGARKFIDLEVQGAFHSPMMEMAALGLTRVLKGIHFNKSPIPVVSNVTGQIIEDNEDFRTLLGQQVCAPVLWEPSIKTLDEAGVDFYLEIGIGKVLTGLNRRIGTPSTTLSIETPSDLKQLEMRISKMSH